MELASVKLRRPHGGDRLIRSHLQPRPVNAPNGTRRLCPATSRVAGRPDSRISYEARNLVLS